MKILDDKYLLINQSSVNHDFCQATGVIRLEQQGFTLLHHSQLLFKLLAVDSCEFFVTDCRDNLIIENLLTSFQDSLASEQDIEARFVCDFSGVKSQFYIEVQHLVNPKEQLLSFRIKKQSITHDLPNVNNLSEKYQRYQYVVEDAHDCILVINRQSTIQMFNDAAQKAFGYELKEILGQKLEILLPEHLRVKHQGYVNEFSKSLQRSREMSSRSIVYARRKNGSTFPAEISISKIHVDGQVEFCALVRDISDRVQLFEELSEHSKNDSLTGLRNRFYIDRKLAQLLELSQRDGWPLSLVLIDLDNFKDINATLGRHKADQIIQVFALEISMVIKKEHMISRYGGEEFLVAIPHCSLDDAAKYAEEFRLCCQYVNNENITASVGVVQFNQNEAMHELISRADSTLFKAKDEGKNRVKIGK